MEKEQTYCTRTFLNLPPEKREHILATAKNEFAARGYRAANINVISEKAGVSVGGMYRYFRTKEDLFLTVVEKGVDALCEALENAVTGEGGLYANIENILYSAYEYSVKDPEMIRMYIDCTSEDLASMAARLSRRMESLSAGTYARWVSDGKKGKEVNPGVDEKIAAFFLDNLFLIFQFSFASEYYHERLKIFTGRDETRVKELVDGLISLIRYGLEGKPSAGS